MAAFSSKKNTLTLEEEKRKKQKKERKKRKKDRKNKQKESKKERKKEQKKERTVKTNIEQINVSSLWGYIIYGRMSATTSYWFSSLLPVLVKLIIHNTLTYIIPYTTRQASTFIEGLRQEVGLPPWLIPVTVLVGVALLAILIGILFAVRMPTSLLQSHLESMDNITV